MPSPTSSGESSRFTVNAAAGDFTSIVGGTKWGGGLGAGATVTFSFPGYGSFWSTAAANDGYGSSSGAGFPWDVTFAPFSEADKANARLALREWERVANIRFVEVGDTASDVGDIRFAYSAYGMSDSAAKAYSPGSAPTSGDIWVDPRDFRGANALAPGSYGFLTLVHEIGHAIGLDHPFERPALRLNPAYDDYFRTVMSYTALAGSAADALTYYPETPMFYDIIAARYIYGASLQTAGNDRYVMNTSEQNMRTLYDVGGVDTLVFTGGGAVNLNMEPNTWSWFGPSLDLLLGGRTIARAYTNFYIFADVIVENIESSTGNDSISGNSISNYIFGGGGNDTIIGAAGNDTIAGGAGNDSLDGGVGFDLVAFSGRRSSYNVTQFGTSFVVSDRRGGLDGSDTVTGFESFQFSDRVMSSSVVATPPRYRDFDGDSRADIILQASGGDIALWLMRGFTITNGAVIDRPSPFWDLRVAADFNNDWRSDIALQGADGRVVLWAMQGTRILDGAVVGDTGRYWSVTASGDFNQDGRSDLLLTAADGSTGMWLTGGLSVVGGGVISRANPFWRAVGAGDLNGDGFADIVLRGTDGSFGAWLMNGTAIIGGGRIANASAAGWSFAGTGDLNGDGFADIILRSAGGAVGAWLMNGTAIIGGGTIATPGANWTIASVADLNGDEMSDLVLRSTGGVVAAWQMSGMSIANGATIATPGTAWDLI